ncbi:MAG: valine--tRNA ligase, partial [Bdellovibrio sp.]|nr:valine--tRNA ligase [Bdellovibrio sp.]
SQITGQLKRMGSSFDWARERFTMDEGLSAAVREVFVRLYNEGLIYRGERIINWCPRCQTALSDLEVIPTDRKGHFWHIIYKIVEKNGTPVKNQDGTQAQLVIATTRAETLLGDTAVAIHPEDERYSHIQGKDAVLPLVGRQIPVIVDEYVDREFGSGGLKVTPAHDFNDYDLGKKHQLASVSVMGKDGKMTAQAGGYAGLKFAEAREKVIEDLKAQGLLVRVEDHAHKVGLCQRCETVAEPIISKQWFVKIKPLADPAIEAVQSGKITFTPKNWEKTYFEWMYNIRDWCISRQLWWGHQIPAWYCADCKEITVAKEAPHNCASCKGTELKQDEDVLDTWFSSALWPFSTLGWPEQTAALKTFYPTAVLETGFDIIFFWVARMIMMGIHFMGDVPFKKVYLHAMVRDEKGEKMSKSKGNIRSGTQ